LHLLEQWDCDHRAVEHKGIERFDLWLFLRGKIGRGHQCVVIFLVVPALNKRSMLLHGRLEDLAVIVHANEFVFTS
jgi:hypothetical protein